jgi:hypothetical protein
MSEQNVLVLAGSAPALYREHSVYRHIGGSSGYRHIGGSRGYEQIGR